MADITFEVLKDGTIKWDIEGSIAAADHTKAELFMAKVGQLCGGETEVTQKERSHHHHDLEIEGEGGEFEHHHG